MLDAARVAHRTQRREPGSPRNARIREIRRALPARAVLEELRESSSRVETMPAAVFRAGRILVKIAA